MLSKSFYLLTYILNCLSLVFMAFILGIEMSWKIKNNFSIYLLFLIIHLSKQTNTKIIQNKLLLVLIMDLHVVLIHVVFDLIDKVKIQFIKLNEPECWSLNFKLESK